MTQPWTRDDTRHWIAQLENRIEDIDYYLNETVKWCEANDIYSDRIVFACAMMTVIWVSHMRHEPITKYEILEIIGVEDYTEVEDEECMLGKEYHEMFLDELLERVVNANFD